MTTQVHKVFFTVHKSEQVELGTCEIHRIPFANNSQTRSPTVHQNMKNILSLALLLLNATAQAQFFHPDSTFGANGFVLPAYSGADQAHAVLVQPADQKILMAGFRAGNCYVARFLPDGQADAGFGIGGRTEFKFGNSSSYGYALALQADGKILVAGDASLSSAGLARLTASGMLDPTFDTDGRLTVPTPNVPVFDSDARLGLAVQPADQRIVLGITSAPDGAPNKMATIHRFLPDGSADLSFSGDGKAFVDFSPGKNEVVSAVAVQPDGKIVVGAFANVEGGNYGNHFAVSRLNTDGSLDSGFGSGGINVAGKGVLLDLRLQPDGKIVTAGYNRYFPIGIQEEKDVALMRFLSNGTLDPAFGTGGTVYTDYGWSHANGMTLQADGKIVVAGFLHPNNPFDFLAGRYHANGSLDLTFRPDGFWTYRINGKDEELHKVAMQANGDIVAVGYYELGGQDESVLLRLTPRNLSQQLPTANFTATNTTGCAPLEVKFSSAASSNTTAWSWQFPGGTPATSAAQNPTVTYAVAGSYAVTLTVSNAAGSHTAMQTNFVTVNPLPTAAFSAAPNGTTVTFSNTSSNAASYLWNFGDSQSSTAASPSHTYAADGTYTVTLSVTNACGTATATQTVTILTAPTANFTANTTSGCVPLAVKFSDQSSSNTTAWSWQFPGGTPATSTAQNPTVTYAVAGSYAVTLTVSNAAGSHTAMQSNFVAVNPLPTAAFSAAPNGTTVTFSNTSSNAASYLWNFGDSQSSTAASPSHTYAADGTYTVTLSATNACGTATVSQEVVIGPGLTAHFSHTNPQGCVPLTVQFADQSQNATTWAWAFPGGTPATSTAQNPSVTYTITGKYDVTLVVTHPNFGTKTKTLTQLVEVQPLPTAAFDITPLGGQTYQFQNASTNAAGYLWEFPGGNPATSTEASPTVTYAAPGTHTVRLSALNNCGASILEKMLMTSGVEEPSWAAGLRIFPNPTDGAFRVEIGDMPTGEAVFALFDLTGRMLHSSSTTVGSGPLTQIFDWGDLPPAVYALRVQVGSQVAARRLVVAVH
jgi:uncharacterized delta-60 repeat protein